MASIFVDIDGTYDIRNTSATVSVNVQIGDGQSGSFSVFQNGVLLGSNQEITLGEGSDITGQKTLISVVVTDVLQETNWTSFTAFFYENGTQTGQFGPYKKLVAAHLDTVVYTLNIFNS